MVKINGQRVEMGEVEVQLGKIEDIKTAVVKAFTDANGQTYICGYFTADKPLSDAGIRRSLQKKFPPYMIPRFLVQIEEFPLTPNGKLDRKALKEPSASDFQSEYIAPETVKEKQICAAFEKLLNIEKVGVNDDFFALGGDSIKVVMLQEELEDFHLSSSQIFSLRTPRAIAGNAQEENQIAFTYEEKSAYPMTDAQLGIYLANIQDPQSLEYNNPASMFFPKEMGVNPEKLAAAVKKTAGMYPFLKVCAKVIDGVPCVCPVKEMEIRVDMESTDETDKDKLCAGFVKPFDFENGPLFRFKIFITPDGLYFFNDVHHLITDGTSTSVFIGNLAKIYADISPDEEEVNGFMLSDYEIKLKDSVRYTECRAFYDSMLAGVETDSNLIPDQIDNPPEKTGAQLVLSLKDYLDASGIAEICKKRKITENSLFLGAFAYALAKQGGQEQALFCTVENGRHLPELRNTYGMLVHTLPFCVDIDENSSVGDYLSGVQKRLFDCLNHDLVSIVQLAGEYEVNSDIIFVYQGEMLNGTEFDGRFIPYHIHKSGDAMSKLSLDVLKRENDYTLSFEYRADLYLAETIENFAQLYINILKGMLSRETLNEIVFCDEREKAFYRAVNDNSLVFDRSLTIVDLFRKQAALHPDRVAIGFKDKKLTYAQLDRYSDNLAVVLSSYGVSREVPVGIMVKRSELFPICTLAVLKAGGGCQPLDSNYPQDRLMYMLEDSKAPVVIADDELAPVIDGYNGVILSANTIYDLPENNGVILTPPAADSLFALIYTSGSTGKPKGCMLEHRNLVNFCLAFNEKFQVTENDRFAAYGAFGFDASMQDLYPALTAGASVYIVPEETRLDLVGLNEFVLGNQITMMDCTTQLGRQYITAYPDSPYMRTFTVGGEKLVPCTPPNFSFVNTYGPTECTIYVTDYEIDKEYASVPIGKSFGNCDIYIVDKQNRLLPAGAVGELAICGYPVTRGYLNRPDLTEEKFIPNPFFNMEGYERMYLTGDVCRYLPDGNIQFVGRRDEQVKIRGFRIELTEIERRIREFETISDASVIAKDLPGGKAVVAYVVSEKPVDISALNKFIADELPKYMVPSVTMQIDKIPLNPNGKVDKRKLPEPAIQNNESEEGKRALNTLEEQLCAMVSEITGFESRSVTDSLVSLGLTSLTTIMFSAKLYERFGLKAGVTELMDDECTLLTVENSIIEHLLSGRTAADTEAISGDINNIPLCAEQLGVYYDSVKRPDALIYNIPMKYTLSKRVDIDKLKKTLEKIIENNPVLTSVVVLDGKEIVQRQMEDFVCDIPVLTLRSTDVAAEEAEFVKPFNLSRGPLFRCEIISTEKNVLLLFDAHHIIFDGLSLSAFIKKLCDVYSNGADAKAGESYYSYIAEEARLEQSEQGKQSLAYYQKLFEDFENASDITGDLNGNADEGVLGEARIDMKEETVNAFCRDHATTPAALFLAATEYAVSRCTADRHVYISMISGGREDIRFMDSFGMFVKSLPLHGFIDTERTAAEFVRDTSAAMREAQKNSAYPFIKLFDKYGFTSKINYACQLGVDSVASLEGEPVAETVMTNPLPKFNLSVHIEDSDNDNIAVNVQYNTALYSEKQALVIASAIAESAKSIISDSGQKLCQLSMLTDADRKILKKFENGEETEITIPLYHKLFEARAAETPDKTALIACDATLTYAELDKACNRVANSLIERGVSKGDRVAFLLPRTSRRMIAMYAILKTGAAYIPCDPEYPDERIRYILENSEARFIVTDKNRGFDNEINIEELLANNNDSNPDVEISPDDTAYLIYTSGSTGRPKGVEIRHAGIANYLVPHPGNAHIHALKNDGNVYVSVTTVSFDMSLKETAASLCNGLTLVLADEDETKDPVKLCELMERVHCDVINATPSRIEQYMMLDRFKAALAECQIIMCGGEKYSPKLLENLKKVTHARIFNTYGPTEITVSCNAKELTNAETVCVGKPLLNVREYIVDTDGNLLPIGMTGELYVGGTGVAKGYCNNPSLTEKSFANYNGERIYKTGDYARWTDDGDVVILGRSDNQVKLRGLRIELGEVERAILSCEGVHQAVALIRPVNGADTLCAWYSADSLTDEAAVRAHISKRLTAYMVPSALMRLDEMPQTPNGKTDVKSLPQPVLSVENAYSEPVTREEKILCDIFSNVLSLEKVSADASFFDLGGTSLTVTGVLVEANEKGLEISYGDIFALKTPRAIAAKCSDKVEFSDGLGDYDYTVFDDILRGNQLEALKEGKHRIGNLLLTGATGFLGIHVLKYFLDNYSGHVYCLLRGSKHSSAEQRLRGQLYYYFEDNFEQLFENRITVIEGSVTDKNWFDTLKNEQIDTVINCAALVKHFSETNDIERVNADGVKNLIDFCKEHNSMIVQVSTGSVAGDRVNGYPSREIPFTEQTLYFGQTIDNQYVHSKFLAERYVLEAIRDGVKGKIMRVGNLAARNSDGEFQINFVTNGFMGRLRAYLVIGAYPYSMMNYPVEMAPIDETAEAIVRLSATPDKCCIFHPFNNHYVPLGDVILQMRKMGFNIRLTEDEEFMRMLQKAQETPEKAMKLTALLAYDNKDSSKIVEMIAAENEYTTQTLYRLGFSWSMTSREYMNSFLTALDGLGFFDTEEELV
ncbi:MAG: amino acid adenylation domain-containing protein [Ruminococcus sp.]|nr:amino acid adenylation domain-containing protein [Ruminococcus sp.]